ncbi:MAG: phosphotyrosine protein phosphatase [Acidiferrobacteraceae bacterium]|nr:phosphotyrosine protein phosphatase [Acidiferrobacteraceae bacterium]
MEHKIGVLFVCLGNICRSPTAEGIFTEKVEASGVSDRFVIDSAGTHAYHIDAPPDTRAQQVARARGIDLSGLRGRQATEDDMARFDYILAMDNTNLNNLERLASMDERQKISLFMSYSQRFDEDEVPDPYYGGISGYEMVSDMIEDAAEGLLEILRREHRI